MDQLSINRKFLVIPIPQIDEFILSFLNRLKKANAYPSLNSVINTIFGKKINIINLVKGNFDKTVFHNFTGLTEDEIDKLCITNNDIFYMVSCLLICPYCIQNKYYISLNSYQKNVLCPVHYIPYISRCPHCNKLLDWDSEKIEVCKFCHTAVYSNISEYVVKYENKINQRDIFMVYNYFFHKKNNSPSRDERYNLKTLSMELKKSIDFLMNPELYIVNEFRYLLLRTDMQFPNYKILRYEVFSLIFKIIGLMKNISISGSKIRICLCNIINYELFNCINDYYEEEFKNFLDDYDFKFSKRVVNLNIRFILNISFDFEKNIIAQYSDIYSEYKKFTFEDFIHFCKSLSKNLSFEDISKDFIFFNNFSPDKQIELLNKIFYTPILLYNFNYEEALAGIKIKKSDLNLL